MLLKNLIYLFVLICFLSCKKQEITLPGRTINCEETFRHLISKIDANYIALKEMEEAGESQGYEEHREAFENRVSGLKGSNCTSKLAEFINWFGDGHLFVLERPEYTEAEKAILNEEAEKNKKDKESVERFLNKGSKDPLVGKWTDGNYLYGIIKERNRYTAHTITSSDTVDIGYPILSLETKSKGYEGVYRGYTNNPRFITGNLYKEGTYLSIFGGIQWKKVIPGSEEEKNIEEGIRTEPDLGIIKKLDNQTVLFEIPSFNVDYSLFRDLVLDNEQLLRNAEFLIIDVRGNTGGNSLHGMFSPLYADRGREASQGRVLASEDNRKYFEWFAGRSPEVYQPVVDRINESPGEIVGGPVFPARPYKQEESKIKKVAILTDEACASACESFLLNSKRISDRVTHYGTPTYGMIDYTSVNMVPLESGNQKIFFGYPTGTLSDTWYTPEYPNGYNENGIRPDIPIPDSVKDKIGFIIEHVSKQ